MLTQTAVCNNFAVNADVSNIGKEETFTDMNDNSLHLLKQLPSFSESQCCIAFTQLCFESCED